jgi:S-formylglutathione hydrolase FrmB
MWCGESDFLLDANIRYHKLLDELGVEHLYEQSEGDHSWRWWDLHIQSALDYLLK